MNFIKVQLENKNSQEFNNDTILDFKRLLLRMESTNHCNFKCTFCPHPKMERSKGFMSEELYYNVINQAAELGIEKLDLRNFGEPLLDKRLGKFAEYAHKKGLNKIYIHTNGYGISEKKLNEWGSAGICDVNISLSPKREFELSRPGVNVDRLFSGIEKVMESSSPYKDILSVDYIRTGKSTEKEEAEFFDWLNRFKLIKRIDIDLHNWAEGLTNKYFQCHRLWTSVTVLWDGRVSLCCLDYEGDICLGNLKDEKLINVINNRQYREIRKNHATGHFLEKCSKCDMAEIKDTGPKPSYIKIG